MAWWLQQPLFTDIAGDIFHPQCYLTSRRKWARLYRKYYFVPKILNVSLYSANLNTLGRRILDPSGLLFWILMWALQASLIVLPLEGCIQWNILQEWRGYQGILKWRKTRKFTTKIYCSKKMIKGVL